MIPTFPPRALSQLAGATVAEKRAAGIAAAPQGNGMLAGNNGQLIGRSLIPGPGIVIRNPDGISGDPEIEARPGVVLLSKLLSANLNSVADQSLLMEEYPAYIPTHILVTNRSATPTAAQGGIYTAPSKGGYTLVPATQSYTTLTDASVVLPLTLGTMRMLTGPRLYLSLTTANGTACTADIYVLGLWLAP